MFRIFDFLDSAEVERLLRLSATLTFEDGRATNPEHALKQNLQARRDSGYQEVNTILQQAVMRNEYFRDYSFPKNMAPPLMTKYEPGMSYGEHVDAAHIAMKPPLRSDISMTVFISDPASYDGGELIIRVADKEVVVKETAGRAVLYPSTFYHRVAPVTRGTRVVAISFIESHVRDAAKRELLIELQEFLHDNAARLGPEQQLRLEYVKCNLQRMWNE